ncbi:MAG: radical SAM protein [Clostridiales bacterium]|nr:radical SAM protein [Clostridiales bacterium]
MRIALLRPLQEGEEIEFQEPLGLFYLAAQLIRDGFDVRIFDRRLYKRDGGSLIEDVRAYRPELIGLTLMSREDIGDARRLIQLLRNPGVTFVAGGLYVTTAYERARTLLPSYVRLLRGEGERALSALAVSVRDGSEYMEPPVLTPDEWPVPVRDGAYIQHGCCINIRSARGCRGFCTFCATPGLPLHSWMGRSVDRVADEIAACHSAYPTASFNFVDDDFGTLERVEELAHALQIRGVRAGFALQLCAPVLYNAHNLAARMERLHAAGLCRIFVGLESVNPETLRRWGKPLDPERLLQCLPVIRSAGVETHIGYILWHAASTARSVLEEASALHENGLFTPKAALSRMVLFPGSALYRIYHMSGEATWEPLSDELETLYSRIAQNLSPLYDVWLRGAVWLPGLACDAFLTENRCVLDETNAVMDRLNETAYRVFTGENIDAENLAASYGVMLRALGCPGL